MFRAHRKDDDYLLNMNNVKNIECVLPTVEIMVKFRTHSLKIEKLCLIYTEKMDFKGLIQLRMIEKCDQRKMYICTVDSGSFQELKQDQSLHVTFGGFVENLVHILKECQAGKLDIYLVQDDRLSDTTVVGGERLDVYSLQFVEMRPFKNLVHLCLPCRMASLNVVLFYMNNSLDELQKKVLIQEESAQHMQREIQNRSQRMDQLETECLKLRENLLDTARNINQKHSEEIAQLQERLKKSAEHRQQDCERSRNTISLLQQQIDKLLAEKSSLQSEKAHELKRNETLNEELGAVKIKASTLKESNEKLHNEISALKNVERKHEMHLRDSRKEANDLKEQIKRYDKSKADLVAELEAEKKISQTKRQALEMATEEISKANQIIVKQTQEMAKYKKTIEWRTEVALQQEQAIKQKDVHVKEKNEQIEFLKHTVDGLRREIPKELDSMRRFATELDVKYSEKINSLQLKLQPLEKENKNPIKDSARSYRNK